MAYSIEIKRRANDLLATRRRNAENKAERIKDKFFQDYPEARNLMEKRGQTWAKLGIAMTKGGNVKENMEKVKAENQAIQKRIDELLKEAGLTRADLEPKYSCSICDDKGYNKNGDRCECYKLISKMIAYEDFNKNSTVKNATFESFDLTRCVDKDGNSVKEMWTNYQVCKDYADNFEPRADGIIMVGRTGLGKTHLSMAIGAVAIEKGYGVISDSAFRILNQIEAERFTSDRNATINLLCNADLLIIDDLGAENVTSYTLAALTNIIDARYANGKSTIVSTNKSVEEFEKVYTERLVSRMFGYYKRLYFSGKDYRTQ